MGQYHLTVNLDKREYLSPHALGDGLKLVEQGLSGPGGIPTALHVLLAVSNGRGGGDYNAGINYRSTTPDEVPEGAEVVGEYGGRVTWVERTPFADLAESVVGRWGGDRIAIIGDYAQYEDLPEGMAPLAYALCSDEEGVRETIAHLRERGHEDEAIALTAQLDTYGTFADITPMVRDYLEGCDAYYHTFRYGDGSGWVDRSFELERRAGV